MLALSALVVATASCRDSGGEQSEGRGRDSGGDKSEGREPNPPSDEITLTEVGRFDEPVAMAFQPNTPAPGALFIGEKGGRVRALGGAGAGAVALDISDRVSTGSEQGLLGIAFNPAGTQLYVNFTERSGDTRVVEYPFAGGRADRTKERLLLAVDQPYANHNGGHLVFDAAGLLYIGLGDGGSGGDPEGNGQDLSTLLGKILRIDPRPSGTLPYTVPKDNPFVGRANARPEIWHYGLRNPWRFSFDVAGGAMWIADVGQDEWEEINRVTATEAGVNFGWNRREGKHRFLGKPVSVAVDPVVELSHSDGNCSVTGGAVYQRDDIAAIAKSYVFGDFCRGELLALRGGEEPRSLGVKVESLSSLGEDSEGHLFVLSLDGAVSKVGA